MKKLLTTIDQANPKLLFWFIVATSIVLAAQMQAIQHGWINPDSVLYLEQAKRFAIGEWAAGFKIFTWPLYGVCIAAIHQLTSLPIHTSAQLLNMLFFGIATASFLHIIKLAGGNNHTWFMGAMLLFSSQYLVGDILEMLMRDEGFWAFFLTALVFFIRYVQGHKLSDALLWQLSIIIATLFRIEAILYLLLLPLIHLLKHARFSIKNTLIHVLKTYAISILLGILMTAAILTQPQLSISNFGRLQEVFSSNLYHELTQKLFTQADIMSSQVLGTYLEEFAVPGLLLTFIYVIGSKILTSTGIIGTLLAFFSFKKTPQHINASIRSILLLVGGIALFTAALITIKVFVLSSRYIIALTWILLIFASFYLAALSLNNTKKVRVIFLALCLILCLGVIKNILPKKDGYNYMQDATLWVKSHNKNASIFYENSRLRYYAKEPFIGAGVYDLENINSNNAQQYDYLVLTFGKRDQNKQEMMSQLLPTYKEIKRFYTRKKTKYCAIYQKQMTQ